jgi:hypothetical protein
MRKSQNRQLSERCESIADQCFLGGLVAITVIILFFAYEVI